MSRPLTTSCARFQPEADELLGGGDTGGVAVAAHLHVSVLRVGGPGLPVPQQHPQLASGERVQQRLVGLEGVVNARATPAAAAARRFHPRSPGPPFPCRHLPSPLPHLNPAHRPVTPQAPPRHPTSLRAGRGIGVPTQPRSVPVLSRARSRVERPYALPHPLHHGIRAASSSTSLDGPAHPAACSARPSASWASCRDSGSSMSSSSPTKSAGGSPSALARARRAVRTKRERAELAGGGGQEVHRLVLPVRLVQPHPRSAGRSGERPVGRGVRHSSATAAGGSGTPTAPLGVDRDAHLRRQAAGEFPGGGDGERHVGADDLRNCCSELKTGTYGGAVDARWWAGRGSRLSAAAALGQRHPYAAAPQHLQQPGARAGDVEGGGERLLQLVAGPAAAVSRAEVLRLRWLGRNCHVASLSRELRPRPEQPGPSGPRHGDPPVAEREADEKWVASQLLLRSKLTGGNPRMRVKRIAAPPPFTVSLAGSARAGRRGRGCRPGSPADHDPAANTAGITRPVGARQLGRVTRAEADPAGGVPPRSGGAHSAVTDAESRPVPHPGTPARKHDARSSRTKPQAPKQEQAPGEWAAPAEAPSSPVRRRRLQQAPAGKQPAEQAQHPSRRRARAGALGSPKAQTPVSPATRAADPAFASGVLAAGVPVHGPVAADPDQGRPARPRPARARAQRASIPLRQQAAARRSPQRRATAVQ